MRYDKGYPCTFALREEELLFRVDFGYFQHAFGGGSGDHEEQPTARRYGGRKL